MRSFRQDIATAVTRKVTRRLLPVLILLNGVIGCGGAVWAWAVPQKNWNFSPESAVFDLAAQAAAYVLFPFISAALLEKLGVRHWLAGLLLSANLGLAAALFGNTTLFYPAYFLLGLAQVGLFPGVIVYLSHWFPINARGRVFALFTLSALMPPLFGPHLTHLLETSAMLTDKFWLGFGISVALCLLTLMAWRFSNRPQQSRCLLDNERDWLIGRLVAERMVQEGIRRYRPWQSLQDFTVWRLGSVYCALVLGIHLSTQYVTQTLAATVLTSWRFHSGLEILPYLLAGTALWGLGRHADRVNEHHWHVALPVTLAALAVGICNLPLPAWATLLLLSLGLAGIWGAMGAFWAFTSAYVTGGANTVTVALVYALGGLGTLLGLYGLPGVPGETANPLPDVFLLALLLLAAAALMPGARFPTRKPAIQLPADS